MIDTFFAGIAYRRLAECCAEAQVTLGGPGSEHDKCLSVAVVATALLVLGDEDEDAPALVDAARMLITREHTAAELAAEGCDPRRVKVEVTP